MLVDFFDGKGVSAFQKRCDFSKKMYKKTMKTAPNNHQRELRYSKLLTTTPKNEKENQGGLNIMKEKKKKKNAEESALLRKVFLETVTQPILSLPVKAQILSFSSGLSTLKTPPRTEWL